MEVSPGCSKIKYPPLTSSNKVKNVASYIQIVEQGDVEGEDLSSFNGIWKTQISKEILNGEIAFLDAIASPSSYPCG